MFREFVGKISDREICKRPVVKIKRPLMLKARFELLSSLKMVGNACKKNVGIFWKCGVDFWFFREFFENFGKDFSGKSCVFREIVGLLEF